MNFRNWYGWIQNYWDAVRSSYWLFPVLMAIFTGVAALALIELDRTSLVGDFRGLPWVSQVSAEGARSVLSTVAGSMMTVTGVVFSITVVALTLASSQFGPRLLRTFFRDRGSQFALGTFLSTFFYSLLVLRAVENPERVPIVATAFAVLLAIFSLFVLIYFIHHVASSLQASSVIASVAAEIEVQLPSLFPTQLGRAVEPPLCKVDAERLERIDAQGIVLHSIRDGYVRILDEVSLVEIAHEHDLLIRLLTRPGRFVTAGQAIYRVLPPHALDDDFQSGLRKCCLLGEARTPVQDLRFSTGQLAEMAVRALSPGINDPNTAIACVHRLGAVVARLTDREMLVSHRFDADERLRVIADPASYGDYLSSCFDSIRRYGAHDARIARALLEAIGRAVDVCRNEARRRLLEEHAEETLASYMRANRGGSPRDLWKVRSAFEGIGSSRV